MNTAIEYSDNNINTDTLVLMGFTLSLARTATEVCGDLTESIEFCMHRTQWCKNGDTSASAPTPYAPVLVGRVANKRRRICVGSACVRKLF